MSIPFNDNLLWKAYCSNPDWHKSQLTSSPTLSIDGETQVRRAVDELFAQAVKQPIVRGVQFIRDAARLVLKVPIRSVWTPIVLEKNWKQLERAKINTKLTGYALVQLVSVPAKLLVALAALITSTVSQNKAKWLLDKSEHWTTCFDGRASQLEALKEEGGKNALSREEYNKYRDWLYSIDTKLCRKDG